MLDALAGAAVPQAAQQQLELVLVPNSLLLLRRIVDHMWADEQIRALLLQRSALEARSAIIALSGASVGGAPLIEAVSGTPDGAPTAGVQVRPHGGNWEAADRSAGFARRQPSRPTVAREWALARGRVNTTKLASIVGAHATNVGSVLEGLEAEGVLQGARPGRRLAILDLSPASHQPMVSASGRWAGCPPTTANATTTPVSPGASGPAGGSPGAAPTPRSCWPRSRHGGAGGGPGGQRYVRLRCLGHPTAAPGPGPPRREAAVLGLAGAGPPRRLGAEAAAGRCGPTPTSPARSTGTPWRSTSTATASPLPCRSTEGSASCRPARSCRSAPRRWSAAPPRRSPTDRPGPPPRRAARPSRPAAPRWRWSTRSNG